MTKKGSSHKIVFLQQKKRKELPMTKDVKMIMTIEIENSRGMATEYMIPSDHFGQKMRKIQKQIKELINKGAIESYENRIRKEEAKGLKVLGRETRVVEMECEEVEIKRRVYQRKDERRWKPLDEQLLFPYFSLAVSIPAFYD